MIVAVTFRVVGWVEHVATVNAGKVLYPLPPAVRDTAVTTPEAIVAVPLAPEPPVPLKVKPVSYTHLDVYKRQIQLRRVMPDVEEFLGSDIAAGQRELHARE